MGRRHEFHATIGSTNDRAIALLKAGAPAGSVVVAEEQTAGRGRMGRSWHSPPGGSLMFSVVLHPPQDALHQVGMVAALAVAEAIEAVGAQAVRIKWPNDLLVHGRKLCGVLPEAAWQGADLVGVVIGIGINVRVNFALTPFAETAISLENHVAGPLNRAELLVGLLRRLDDYAAMFGADAIFSAWKARLDLVGSRITVNLPHGPETGLVEDVESDGAVLLRTSEGIPRRVIAGDIALVK